MTCLFFQNIYFYIGDLSNTHSGETKTGCHTKSFYFFQFISLSKYLRTIATNGPQTWSILWGTPPEIRFPLFGRRFPLGFLTSKLRNFYWKNAIYGITRWTYYFIELKIHKPIINYSEVCPIYGSRILLHQYVRYTKWFHAPKYVTPTQEIKKLAGAAVNVLPELEDGIYF